jgi:hypothetical protein
MGKPAERKAKVLSKKSVRKEDKTKVKKAAAVPTKESKTKTAEPAAKVNSKKKVSEKDRSKRETFIPSRRMGSSSQAKGEKPLKWLE